MVEDDTHTPDIDQLYSDLVRIVRKAGDIALSYYGQHIKSWDKSHNNPVSDADLAVNRYLQQELQALDSEIGWLSEENEDTPHRLKCTYIWAVDPIDGTRAFLQGLPEFTVSVGLIANGRPCLAALYNPVHDELFQARLGHGAHLNGMPIRVNDHQEIHNCRLFAYRSLLKSPRWTTPWPDVKLGMVNSVAYRLALIAAGQFDAIISLQPKNDWDLAAAELILQEAGGVLTDRQNRTHQYNQQNPQMPALVAAAPQLHAKLLNFLQQYDSRYDAPAGIIHSPDKPPQ
ncbi:MAG: 3'(2'),5'-bisphosphate nucleotidase CysQ [Kordiimonas sp.]|nr:3'(2'),5'-bisphosphate nucleotidase CysQ [Kordiimonas sp.]